MQLRRRVRAESALELLARTDGLTGLNNRRSLGEILELEWRRAKTLTECAVAAVRRYRSIQGLQTTPTAIRPATIPWPLLPAALPTTSGVRLTVLHAMGERSLLSCFPDTSALGASLIAEKIRSAICACHIEHAGSEFGCVTASIGAVSREPQMDDDLTTRDQSCRRSLVLRQGYRPEQGVDR